MLKKIVEKTPRAALMVGGVLGIAWIVNKVLIEILQKKASSYDTKSRTPDLHPVTKRYYKNQARDIGMIAGVAQRVDSLHPLTIVERYGIGFYERHFGGNGHRQY